MAFCLTTSVDLIYSVCPLSPIFEGQVQVISSEDGLGDCIMVLLGNRTNMKCVCVHTRAGGGWKISF